MIELNYKIKKALPPAILDSARTYNIWVGIEATSGPKITAFKK